MNAILFQVSGPGEIVATDNGDATDRVVFASNERRAFNGMALAIVRGQPGHAGKVVVTARARGLLPARVTLTTR
jgi:beta-galactosidase